MIRLLSIVIGLVFASGLKAQEWFPIGATWYYNQIILLQGETYVQFEVTGDTILQGKTCKIVNGGCSCAAPGPGGYFYQEGDKVYAYHGETESFRIFYDFTLEAGDTIVFEGDTLFGGNGYFLIDSITTMQFGSETRRVQHLTHLEYDIVWGNKIIEGIGSNGCMYPQVSFCDPITGGLRCYEDDQIGLINFQMPVRSCTYITSDVKDPVASPVLKLYPNPATDYIRIQSDKPIQQLTLFNNLGMTVYQLASVSHTEVDIEVHSIPGGIYWLRAMVGEQEVVYKAVVVER